MTTTRTQPTGFDFSYALGAHLAGDALNPEIDCEMQETSCYVTRTGHTVRICAIDGEWDAGVDVYVVKAYTGLVLARMTLGQTTSPQSLARIVDAFTAELELPA